VSGWLLPGLFLRLENKVFSYMKSGYNVENSQYSFLSVSVIYLSDVVVTWISAQTALTTSEYVIAHPV
jgi:hypothetical protein